PVSLVLLHILRLPACSSFFPYTTLFRSGMFEDCWRAEFARSESAITAATGRIVNLLPYFEHCHRAGSLQALGEKQWFRERVFDNYLWYVGGNVLAARKQRRKQRKKRVQVGAGV